MHVCVCLCACPRVFMRVCVRARARACTRARMHTHARAQPRHQRVRIPGPHTPWLLLPPDTATPLPPPGWPAREEGCPHPNGDGGSLEGSASPWFSTLTTPQRPGSSEETAALGDAGAPNSRAESPRPKSARGQERQALGNRGVDSGLPSARTEEGAAAEEGAAHPSRKSTGSGGRCTPATHRNRFSSLWNSSLDAEPWGASETEEETRKRSRESASTLGTNTRGV